MNSISGNPSARTNWQALVMFALGFWLSGSLLLDLVVIPSLFVSGMMAQSGFASAGYSIFGLFNRIELLCAALVLTGVLILCNRHQIPQHQQRWAIALSTLLLSIAIIYTYVFIPQMSSLGLQLNLFDAASSMPPAMVQIHEGYWGLECLKLLAGAILLRWCYRDSCTLVE